MSIVIMRGSEVVLAEGYGFADVANSVAATSETVYPIGSISKQFTAAATMKLVEQGRIRLNDPVRKYLPELRDSSGTTLVLHLLRQTSGIPDYTHSPEIAALHQNGECEPADFALQSAVSVVGGLPRLYDPGDWWSYSNSNYLLLAALIERKTGQSFGDFLTKSFFEPLGLRTASICGAERAEKLPQAVGYFVENDSAVIAPNYRETPEGRIFPDPGGGGICASVNDLAKWMRALVDGNVVAEDSYLQMTNTAPVGAGFIPPYGFGLSLTRVIGERAIWHTGVAVSHTAALIYFPDHDVIIAIITNKALAMIPFTASAIARAVLNLPESEIKAREVSEAEVQSILGTYDDYVFQIRIFFESNQLQAHISGMGFTVPLISQSENEFVSPDPPGFRFTFEPSGKRAKRVVFNWFEIQSYAERIK